MKTVDKFNNIVNLPPIGQPGDNEQVDGGVIFLHTGFILQLAFPVLLCITALLISIGYFLEYPQITRARISVTEINTLGNLISMDLDFPQNTPADLAAGQKVQILFDLYPNKRYGSVAGILQSVPAPDRNGFLTAKVYLPYKLMADHKTAIPYKKGLKADMLIVTENMRLFQRLFRNYKRKTGD